MERSPAERCGQQQKDQKTVGVGAGKRIGEPVECPILGGRAAFEARGSSDLSGSRPHLEARLEVVRRTREEVLRVAPQGVRGIGGGDAGGDVGASSRQDLHRVPADASGKGVVDQRDPADIAGQRSREIHLDARQEEPALTRGKAEPGIARQTEAQGLAVRGQLEARGDLGQL
jgi:hypothetical protein